MPLKDKHVAILVEEAYQEMEIWYPAYRLREAGVRVSFVGTGTRETYPSKLGYPCTADRTAATSSPEEFDAVLIPGGWAPDFLRRDPAVNRLVAEMEKAGKIVAAICHGGWVLCSAHTLSGFLKGRRVTSFMAIKDDLINCGAEWVDEETVVDGRLITARKPDDLPRFTRALLEALES